MADSWIENLGLDELQSKLGSGGITGASLGAGIALLGMITGALNTGWLSYLLVPAAALLGGALGDFITKDGPVFGKNGLVNAVSNRFKPKTIPEGYTAVSAEAHSYAASSAIIASTGHVHTNVKTAHGDETLLGYQEQRPLDPFVEYDLNKDERLKSLREKARTYGKRFATKESAEYIADVHQREEKITKLILQDVYEQYGSYSSGTLANGKNNDAEYEAVHHPKRMILGGASVDFARMKKGQLVCRHYAPIMSVLLHEASVPNHMVCSAVAMAQNKDGRLSLEKSYIQRELRDSGWDSGWSHHISPHAYVITDEGNAIVEGTVAGRPDNDVDKYGRVRKAYAPIINGVTVQDIIHRRKTAITEIQEGRMQVVYGGDNGIGDYNTAEQVIEGNIRDYDSNNRIQKLEDQLKKALQPNKDSSIQSPAAPMPTIPNQLPNLAGSKPAAQVLTR